LPSIYLVLAASEVLSYAMTTAGISAWVRGLGVAVGARLVWGLPRRFAPRNDK
jgi:preprotein translocase subunit SecD